MEQGCTGSPDASIAVGICWGISWADARGAIDPARINAANIERMMQVQERVACDVFCSMIIFFRKSAGGAFLMGKIKQFFKLKKSLIFI